MLAVVQLHARLGIDERKSATSQVVAALNQGDGDAAVGEGAGGRQAPPAHGRLPRSGHALHRT